MASPLRGRSVLLGVSGGIAAYKSAYLARLLRERGADVHVLMTEGATRFVGPDTFAALTGNPVHTGVFDAAEEVRHVRLAHRAHAAVVAPATANVIAKLALGLADDMLSSTLLEFRGPLVVAPAMHTGMHASPATQTNLETLDARGAIVVGPVEGALAAGDSGMGRMSDPEEIAAAVEASLAAGDLAGRHVLVTAGPTHEPIDAVRFVGNRSSGRMGYAVAAEAAARGATVTLVSGPTHLPDPPGAEVIRVETAEQMREAVRAHAPHADAIVMAAAVADFRPADPRGGKIKKEGGPPEVRLEPVPDILREIAAAKEHRIHVGFAAETSDVESEGRKKLAEKDLDLVVANEVGRAGTGFDAETNHAAILARLGDDVPLRDWTKRELAAALCDRLAKLLSP